MPNKENIAYSIAKLNVKQFAIINDLYDKESKDIDISIGIKVGSNIEKKDIVVVLKVEFIQKKKPFIILETESFYKTDDDFWDNLEKSSDNDIPKNLAVRLLNISLGTFRGILFEKLNNTEFDEFLFPLINADELLENGENKK